MAVTIESLLEENLGKVQDLLQALEQLKERVDISVVPIDGRVAGAEKQLAESVQKIWRAKEVLGVIDEAFETSTKELETRLDQLDTQCDAIGETLPAVVKAKDQVITQLDAGAAKLDGLLNEKHAAAESELKAIKTEAAQLKTLIDQKMNDLNTSSSGYVGQVEAEFEKLRERYTNLNSGFDTFATKGGQMMDAAKEAMDKALAEVKQELDAVATAFSEKIKKQIEQAAAEEAAKVTQEVKGSISDVKQQVEASHQPLRDAKDAVETEMSDVTNGAAQAAASMQQAQKNLDMIASWM